MFQINSGLHLSSPLSIIPSIKVRIACGDTAEAILLIFFSFSNKSVIMNYFPILTRPSLVSEPSSTSCFFPYRWYSRVARNHSCFKTITSGHAFWRKPKKFELFPKILIFYYFLNRNNFLATHYMNLKWKAFVSPSFLHEESIRIEKLLSFFIFPKFIEQL